MKRICVGLAVYLCLLAAALCLPADAAAAQALKGTLGASSIMMSGKWEFHTGDDMAWANPSYDDSSWETITADEPWGAQGHPGYTGFAWYRRAVELSGSNGADGTGPISLYVPQVDDAYEVYWNGQRIGGFGSLPPHARWNQDTVSNVYAIPDPGLDPPKVLKGVLAIRVWKAMLASNDPLDSGGFEGPPRIGDRKTIADALALEEDRHERGLLLHTVEGAILLLVGMISVGMWAFDRSRKLYLWLGAFLMGLSGRSVYAFPAWNHFATIEIDQIRLSMLNSGRDLGIWMLVMALFGLGQEKDRDKGWRRTTKVLATIYLAAVAIDLAVLPFWQTGWTGIRTIDWATTAIYSFLPAYLFVLLAAGIRRTRDLALLPTVLACAALESYLLLTELLGQGVQFTGIHIEAIFAAAMIHLGPYSIGLQSQLEALVLVVLVATVYREQARERRRQVFIESELQSAREIQSVLVPEQTPEVPGFAISSLYWPAGEVGGDMFQVIPGREGDVLVVLADVSGKGLKAAMTVSLMVGVVRTLAAATSDPLEILRGMNDRLVGRSSGGFSTCLVLHVRATGEVTMANAGHLAPFVNGEALAMEGSLPLGIVAGAEFAESSFRLREGDEVSLYTDGVVEAQRPDGELFGFERAAELMRSRPSVQEIAEAARTFGQQDDITVVKIVRVREEDARQRMSIDLRTSSTDLKPLRA